MPPPLNTRMPAAPRPHPPGPGGGRPPEGTDPMLTKIQSFYGFSKMPFGRDIAPGQLHRHHGHAEAVARLTWAITTRSLAVLTGEVGAGKTAAVRAALAGTDPVRYRPIYLPNPAGIGIRGICQQVVTACGHTPRFHTGSLLPQAADALAAEAAERGRTPILILDEAHQLDAAQLETIRMLTSYDLDSVTCFAALLIGQPTPRPRRARKRHPVLRRRDHPDPRHQPGPAPHHQQPLHPGAHRGLRRRPRHCRSGCRPVRDHRSHRDNLSTTRDTPGTSKPRRNPSGGVSHSQDIPKINVTDILKINVAQQLAAR